MGKGGARRRVAMGSGARRGAEMDAQRRGARGGCKAVLQKRGALRGFAVGGVATKRCSVGLQWERVQGGVQKWMHKGEEQGGVAKPCCKQGVHQWSLQWGELQGRDVRGDCNTEACTEGCKSGCTKEGRKGGLQKRGVKARCTEGLCNRADCNQVMQHGIAIGRGARGGVEMDAF